MSNLYPIHKIKIVTYEEYCKRHGLELAPNFYQIVEGHIKKRPYKKSRKRHYEKKK